MSVATITNGAFCLSLCVLAVMAAPYNLPKDPKKTITQLRDQLQRLNEIPGLDNEEYLRYWKEAIQNDPNFEQLRKAIQQNKQLDLESIVERLPQLTERLAKQSGNVRSRLEEAKRASIEDMRQLQRLQMLKDDHALKDGDWNTKLEALRDKLPPHFTDKDIKERIEKQRVMMENIDQERRAEFKRAEMAAEHRRREMLKTMDERNRLKAEEEYQKKQEKLRGHARLHNPGGEQQLEDVWEQQDGLDRDQFDPRTFFHLHDKNSDRHLDAMEWETLFYNELRKVYGDDMGGMEAREDLARMREHVVKEMDRNKDGLVSLEEFLQFTNNAGFKEDEEWKSLVDEDPFTEEELDKYEDNYEDYEYDYEYDEHGNIIALKTKQKKDKTPSKVNEKDDNDPDDPPKDHKQQADNQEHPAANQGNPPGDNERVPLPDDAVNAGNEANEGLPGENVDPARVAEPQGQDNL